MKSLKSSYQILNKHTIVDALLEMDIACFAFDVI